MELDDPTGDPNAHVVMFVWLAKDEGYWRVVQLGFDNATRVLKHDGAGGRGPEDEGT
jgi:hypothetical protein